MPSANPNHIILAQELFTAGDGTQLDTLVPAVGGTGWESAVGSEWTITSNEIAPTGAASNYSRMLGFTMPDFNLADADYECFVDFTRGSSTVAGEILSFTTAMKNSESIGTYNEAGLRWEIRHHDATNIRIFFEGSDTNGVDATGDQRVIALAASASMRFGFRLLGDRWNLYRADAVTGDNEVDIFGENQLPASLTTGAVAIMNSSHTGIGLHKTSDMGSIDNFTYLGLAGPSWLAPPDFRVSLVNPKDIEPPQVRAGTTGLD